MLRLRRYRIFVVTAVLLTVGLYQLTGLKQWFPDGLTPRHPRAPVPPPDLDVPPQVETRERWTEDAPVAQSPMPARPSRKKAQVLTSVELGSPTTPAQAPPPTEAPEAPPENQPHPIAPTAGLGENKVGEAPPGPGPGPSIEAPSLPSPAPIHWTKFPERYPVPSESLINLPTDKPKAIPRVQHAFGKESAAQKEERLQRLKTVKEALLHTWAGYRKHAWLHDEVRPLTGKFRDPFGGWAATLVDTLDTLWIAGFHAEFDEAAKAVDQIDFTTSSRNDIQLFETTIRYLGGLLGAYDVSGGKYRNLLDKAVELAEILLSAWDTPNRMPVTFYRWKPDEAALPLRAASRVVLAELGSLSVEFTRLAQITKEPRYYDAVARITNELETWQNQTRLPGMWPVMVDASGCRTVNDFMDSRLKPVKVQAGPPVAQPETGPLDANADPPGKDRDSHQLGWESANNLQKRELMDGKPRDPPEGLLGAQPAVPPTLTDVPCERQGLTSPPYVNSEEFTLGGMSDSTYEYLPKQYMLLGGHEQSRRMYELAMDTVKEHVLFRPMTIDNRDVLFAGKRVVSDMTPTQLIPEGSHLTCFAGGMFAIGSKIFNRPDELDLAAKLTDGCVWAYESTTTGVMPEGFLVLACDDAAHSKLSKRQLDGSPAQAGADEPMKPRSPGDEEAPLHEKPSSTSEEAGSDPRLPRTAFVPSPPMTHERFAKMRIEEERFPPGFTGYVSKKYILRPEAIESVFILYRTTGSRHWQDAGWKMFTAIEKATRAEWGYSAIFDVTSAASTQLDEMESFWSAETLKYFLLLYSEPDVISLDEWVL
ncbi:MAG: hypothetical protein M1826_003844 [Phylliscum demangeonii]|nr:MAG: hypothetical protein M1826_003844 [Phylliscum demangeonii]